MNNDLIEYLEGRIVDFRQRPGTRNKTKTEALSKAVHFLFRWSEKIGSESQVERLSAFGISKTPQYAILGYLKAQEKARRLERLRESRESKIQNILDLTDSVSGDQSAEVEDSLELFQNQLMLSDKDLKKLNDLYEITKFRQLKSIRSGIKQILDEPYQQMGFAYHEDLIKPVKADEARKFLTKLRELCKRFKNVRLILVGDFRSNVEESHAVEVLVIDEALKSTDNDYEDRSMTKFRRIVDTLRVEGLIEETLISNRRELFALSRLDPDYSIRHLRLHWTPSDLRYFRKFFLTGPERYVKQIQVQASKTGLKLTEKGLFSVDEKTGDEVPVKVTCERDLIHKGIYLAPDERRKKTSG